jgi:hypothetical protein
MKAGRICMPGSKKALHLGDPESLYGVITFVLNMRGELGNIISDWHHSHQTHSPKWLDFTFVILISLVLVVSNWTAINTANLEVEDFAANSLLIQDAKSLTLLKGNYSRVGFNHPGPAILYVLAAGEVVFYDWLHIVKSPLSGQLIAVTLYTAFWVVLIWRMIAAMTHQLAASFLTVSVFLIYAVLCDHRFLTGMWFPHLYFFPFAAMLVAASRLMSGNTDFLKALAISCGFLISVRSKPRTDATLPASSLSPARCTLAHRPFLLRVMRLSKSNLEHHEKESG